MNFRYTLFALAAFTCCCSALRAADDPAFMEQVRQDIARLQEEKRGRTATQRKVSSSLLAADRARKFGRVSDAMPELESGADVDAEGLSLVDMKGNVTPALLAEIRRVGGRVEYSHAGLKSVRARIPVAAMEQLAARADIRSIKPAARCKTNAGARVSEGDIAHRANLARTMFAATGRGVKVGVLSDSLDHLSRSQSGGELSRVLALPGESGLDQRQSGEGTAMLEIVHDLAPDAELFFATAFKSAESFAQNIRDLAAAGCSVIIDDVGYFNESPFQDDVIALAVREVAEKGVLYFSAAGNSGNFDDGTSGTWEGDFVGQDRGSRLGLLHDFGGGVTANKVSGGGFANLFWADPLDHSANDYDLYVVNGRGRIVRASDDFQDGDDDPYEIVRVRRGERLIIAKASGEDRFLYLDTQGAPLQISTAGNIRGHAAVDTVNAYGVAAARASRALVPFAPGELSTVERFSSDGFRRMFFNPDGTPITPGDFSAKGGKVIMKPDITAADGVTTSVPGFRPFFGTSAAAPHAGAIAALLKSFKPNLTGEQVRAVLQSTALDIADEGVDRDSGAGILDAQAALQSVASAADLPPIAAISPEKVTYLENADPVPICPAGTITDSDNTDFQGGSLTVAIAANEVGGDRLQVLSEGFEAGQIGVNGTTLSLGGEAIGSISGTSPLVISFSSPAVTPSVASRLMHRIAFDNTSERPTPQDRTVRLTINDGRGETGSDEVGVVVVLVNDAPTFTKGPDKVTRDDATEQKFEAWATNISPGIGEEDEQQTVTFKVATDNDEIFESAPAITPEGTLTYTLKEGGSSFATVTVVLQDSGGNLNGGTNTSEPQTFRIYRNPENIPPSFTPGPDIVVGTDSGPASIPHWATAISAGIGESQVVDFVVMPDNPALFSIPPAMSADGTLTFTPAPNARGVAVVSVAAHDNGGGADTSPAQAFTIVLAPYAEQVGLYDGLVTPAESTPAEFARFGMLRALVSRNGGFTARLTLAGRSYLLRGDVRPDGTIAFGKAGFPTSTLPRPGLAPLTIALRLGNDVLLGTINDGATAFASASADRAAYSTGNPAPPLIPRRFTSAFPARSAAEVGLASTAFPQGDGFAVGSLQSEGFVRLVGRLADGSKFTYASAVSKANTFPLHLQTDRRRGSLTGLITFRDMEGVSDLDAANLSWFKPASARTKSYRGGWPGGINTDLVGSAFVGPPVIPALPIASADGNALLSFTGVGIGDVLEKMLSIDFRSRSRVIGRDDDRLRFRLNTRSGAFSASLKDSFGRDRVRGGGVVLQKQRIGTGFFIEDRESGGIRLLPAAQ